MRDFQGLFASQKTANLVKLGLRPQNEECLGRSGEGLKLSVFMNEWDQFNIGIH